MPYKCISIDEARAMMDSSEVTVADVRDQHAYRSGAIENAFHLQQDSIEEFLEVAARDKPLIIYCYHGHSSQSAANYFSEIGFAEVYSVDGGYEAWRLKY